VRTAAEQGLLRFTGTADRAEFERAVAATTVWYHRFGFGNGFEVRGDYDVARDVRDYGFPEDLSGLSVLDIGPASGWFSLWFEQRGAEVTAVDVAEYHQLDLYGRAEHSPEPSDPDRTLVDRPPFGRMNGTFQVMHELLGSQVEFVVAPVYDLTPELFGGRRFDLVFMGAVLQHLRDPIGALRAARRVCGGELIATTWLHPDDESDVPRADLPYLTEDEPFSWWRPNRACLELWLKAAGFSETDASGSVMLHSDRPRAKEHNSDRVNPDQLLGLIHARP
jgi:SAM-dependent methyltransferase